VCPPAAALQGRLAQAGSATQQAWAHNRATVRAAREEEEDLEVDQLSAAYGHGAEEGVRSLPVPQIRRSSSSSSQGRSPSPIIRSARSPTLALGKRTPRGRSASPSSSHGQSPIADTPSGYAQNIVRGLGVHGNKASAAAQIVDKVMKLSAAQLQAMDPDTREQVMRVRRDLGLGEPSQSSSRNASPANAFTDSGGDRARRQHSQQR
jgi:hypothetical protein